jgi:hypothetical protein
MRLTSTGLGIGTSSPTEKLQVVGKILSTGDGRIGVKKDGSDSVGSGPFFGMEKGDATRAWFMQLGASNTFDWWYYGGGATYTKYMSLDGSGNLGLGVTPSASSFTTMQIKNASLSGWASDTSAMFLTANASFDGTNFRYISTNWANQYRQQAGQHYWYNAPSGTAGNAITWTQAMTLDASGNLGIGTTSPAQKLHIAGNAQVKPSTGTDAVWNRASNDSGEFYLGIDNSAGSGFTGTAYARFLYGNGAYPMLFYTNGSERARIDSSGNLLVGRTGQINQERLGVTTATDIACSTNRASSTAYYPWIFYSDSTTVGYIYSTSTTTTYATSSDYRLKNTITPMTGALAKVAALKPCTYKWNADGSDGEGFIAHELAEVVPQCVTGEKDAVDAEGNPVYQGIDTSFLVATLTAAIQELKAEFDAYKASHP